jgi:NosR/NirI family transcriptional regulator, nitrous oxide reductase regulator
MSNRIGTRWLVAGTAVVAAFAQSALAQDDAGWNFEEFADDEPGWLELLADQAPDLALFAAFATLAMVSFLRKSIPLKYVTLVLSVALLGIYNSHLVSITNVLGSLTGTWPFHAETLTFSLLVIFMLVTTVLWGRVYCGRVCAFGALTQLIDAVVPSRWQIRIPATLERRASYIKYAILFGAIAWYLVTHENGFYRYIEPFWMFSFEATTPLWIGLGLLLVASVFVRNLYCRFLCPLGAALGLVSNLSAFKIKRWSECSTCQLCEKACEWGAIRKRQIVMSECVRCDECEILYASKTRCPHWLLIAKRARQAVDRPKAPG